MKLTVTKRQPRSRQIGLAGQGHDVGAISLVEFHIEFIDQFRQLKADILV